MQRKKMYFAVALTLLLGVAFIATSSISYWVAHDSLTAQLAEETLPLTSDNVYSEIQRDLVRSTIISSLMASDTFVRDWVVEGEEDTKPIIRYLAEIQERYHTTTAFFVSERTRRYYHRGGVIKTVDRADPRDRWYFRVRLMDRPYEINVDADTADRSRVSIFVNHQMHDYSGKFIGAIGIGLSVNAAVELIETYQKRYGRRIYLVDDKGKIALHGVDFKGASRLQERPGIARVASSILSSPSTTSHYSRADGRTVFVNSRLIPELDWYLIIEQVEAVGGGPLWNAYLFNILLSLGVTVLVITVGYFTIRGHQRSLEQMATTDRLTGTANRQIFGTLFEQLARQSRRRGGALSVISVDIDRFKEINDTYGHPCGDAVLRTVANVLRSHVRGADVVCRWGGEEFLVLLADCALSGAEERGMAMHEAVGLRATHYGREEIFVTISVGVAELHEGEDLASLIQRADMALYQSKRHGRNRVSSASR